MFRLIDITIDIIFFSIDWKNYFDRSILVISMTVLTSALPSSQQQTRPGTATCNLGVVDREWALCMRHQISLPPTI